MSTAAVPEPGPRGLKSWRSARRTTKERRKAKIERRKAATLPPLVGSEKSGARFYFGMWQYWVLRLPMGTSAITLSLVHHQLRHHLVWLALAASPVGLETALGERRRPSSWWRQGGHIVVTAIGWTAAPFGGAELWLHHWLLGAVTLGAGGAFVIHRWLAKRAFDRQLDDSRRQPATAVTPAELPA